MPEKRVSVNTMYLIWALDPGTETIVGCAGIAVIVILFSVIVIYNIFQVGITQKIQEYGKLKALGMTKKQLKQVIQREGMSLALIGVPIGLVFGYIVSFISFYSLFYGEMGTQRLQEGAELIKISLFSFPMLLIVIVLSFATVWVALKKPMKIVASVSTIEAIRYQESSTSKRGNRIGKELPNVKSLMLANLSQNRKRTVTTILTMGLSCVLFVVVANLVGNMDEEYEARRYVEHGKFKIELDYRMNDKAYPENNLDHILLKNPLSDSVLEKIREIDGVKNVKTRKIFIMDVKGHGPMTVSVLDQEEIRALEKETHEGSLNYKKAVKDHAIFYGSSYFLRENGFEIGQKLDVTLPNKKAWNTTVQGATGPVADTDWLMSEDTFQELDLEGELNGYVYVDCKEKDLRQVETAIGELFEKAEHIEISTYQDALKNMTFAVQFMKYVAYAFLFIIGLIGFMNLMNTMITNVITRRQEFGVLQAIGMTNKQLNQMLQREGLLFTIGTILVSVVFGLPLGYAFFCYGKEKAVMGLHVYHFPVLEIILMFVVIIILQLTLSFILSRNIKKDSLVERIRYQG
ncbi:MAG: ABC transporter permease [Lachnospiraceae bacterium]|nr:ABC transporter permease [Lachnospiraceae bacterium]